MTATLPSNFIKTGMMLPMMESFYTIQGEGVFSGHAAYFIRLAGCDVGCFWCDVKESWYASKHPISSVEKIVEKALLQPSRLAVITGGEPLMHNLAPLTASLQKKGFKTHIETSGTQHLSGYWDWICLSPKKFKTAHSDIFKEANELKVIAFNKSDLTWAQEQAEKVSPTCQLLIQPEWSKNKEILPLIIDFVKENPEWKISLQTHKYVGIP